MHIRIEFRFITSIYLIKLLSDITSTFVFFRLVRSYTNAGNTREIKETVALLGDEFTLSQNPNSRKGGLIGLAACAIALGNQVIYYMFCGIFCSY